MAIFYSDRFLLTIHRKDQAILSALIQKWSQRRTDVTLTPERLLVDLLHEAVRSYRAPVMGCLGDLELMEAEIFGAGTQKKFRLSRGYYLKRKISVYKTHAAGHGRAGQSHHGPGGSGPHAGISEC
ncbi:MAG: hypothetical protein HC902_04090 [Calothrix sp. SM1_5_4]|nr:hypothetical protein [Calothrix sp. SM1_5_4]